MLKWFKNLFKKKEKYVLQQTTAPVGHKYCVLVTLKDGTEHQVLTNDENYDKHYSNVPTQDNHVHMVGGICKTTGEHMNINTKDVKTAEIKSNE